MSKVLAVVSDIKGVVLAAGLGTRLKPLTTRYPKPLIPFCGTTPLALALWRLKSAGIDEVAINAHYLPEQIAAVVKQNPLQQNLKFSLEAEILGTGGAYNPLRQWQGGSDLVVINGDVVTDIDVPGLIAHHRAAKAIATMALLPNVIANESPVFYHDDRVAAIGTLHDDSRARPGNFACVQVLSKAFVNLLPKAGFFDVISKGYQVALAQGLPIGAFVHKGCYWHDLRSPEFYWLAVREFLNAGKKLMNVGVQEVLRHTGTAFMLDGSVLQVNSTQVDASAQLGPEVVIEAGCLVGAGAVVRRSILLPGAVVGTSEVVEGAIVGQGLRVPLP